jgi:DNA-directed RNA polymerase specialized sigma24 family protein
MSHENDLEQMPLGDLAKRCAQETDSYFRKKNNDSRYCLELFRRAIVSRDNDAWEAIYIQYQPQVERWVYRHPKFSSIDQEAQDLTMQAIERFLKYFTAEKFSVSPSLPAILNYLQTCVNGTILDCWRKIRQVQFEQLEEDHERKILDNAPSIEDTLEKEELWQLVKSRLKDDKEYTLVYASIVLDLSSRQILVEYPHIFQDISEIYRCSANVWARLQRDSEIRKFLKLK